MYRKVITCAIALILIVGVVSAVPLCPMDPITPTEMGVDSFETSIVNGGLITGFMFGSTESVLGINQTNETGYMSTSRSLLGKGIDLKYANEFTQSDVMNSETGFTVGRGRLNYDESTMYSVVSNDTHQYCEQALSGVNVMLTEGTFGSTMSNSLLGSTSLLNHDSAVIGTGSYSAIASYSLLQGTNSTVSEHMFTRDSISMIGKMEFARQVHFKSVKS